MISGSCNKAISIQSTRIVKNMGFIAGDYSKI